MYLNGVFVMLKYFFHLSNSKTQVNLRTQSMHEFVIKYVCVNMCIKKKINIYIYINCIHVECSSEY